MDSDLIPPVLALDREPFTLEELDQALEPLEPGSQALADALTSQGYGLPGEDFIRNRDGSRPDGHLSPFEVWEVGGLDEAQWAMAHVARLNAAETEADQLAVAMQARIDAWRKDQVERIKRRREFFV